MKKVLFAAIAALTITGCSQNEEIERAADKAEINFNTAVTRAVTMTTSDFRDFSVSAYSHTNNFEAGTTIISTIMDKTAFTSGDGAVWTADGKKFYWPATGNVSFFGYSVKTISEVNYAKADGGLPTLNYTVKTTAADQEDLLVAQAMNKTSEDHTVNLAFGHALTKVAFKVRGEGDGVEYELNKIVVKAMNKGTYTYTADGTKGSWGTTGATLTPYTVIEKTSDADKFSGLDTGSAEIEGTTYSVDYTSPASTLMLIPQALSGVTVEVSYKATLDNVVICNAVNESLSLTGNWTPGQNVVYTLVLKPGKEITITGNFNDDWNSTGDEDLKKE